MRTLSIAFLTAIFGAIAAIIGGNLATAAHHVSDFEGARGMFIVFVITPAGLIAGAIIGAAAARAMPGPGSTGFLKAQGIALAVTAAAAVVVFGLSIAVAPRQPLLDGEPLVLDFEVRMPDGRAAPDSASGFTVLFTAGDGDDRANARLHLDAVTQSDGRVVIPADADINTTTSRRSLVVNDVDGKHYWFDMPLRARPRATDEEWIDWWPAPGHVATNDINGNGGYQIRYRVRKIGSRDSG